jgi:hypothetical protein
VSAELAEEDKALPTAPAVPVDETAAAAQAAATPVETPPAASVPSAAVLYAPPQSNAHATHWRCLPGLALTVAVLITLVGTVLIASKDVKPTNHPFFIALMICASLYLLCVLGSRTLRALWNVSETAKTAGELGSFDQMRRYNPVFNLHIQCYHHETRTSTYTDSKGNRRTRTSTVRVNTSSASGVKRYQDCLDLSGPGPTLASLSELGGDYVALTVSVCPEVVLDPDTERSFDEQKQQFVVLNKRDTHYDLTESVDYGPAFQDTVMLVDRARRPWWLRRRYYLASSVLLCNSCYQAGVQRVTAEADWTLKKRVSIAPLADVDAIQPASAAPETEVAMAIQVPSVEAGVALA